MPSLVRAYLEWKYGQPDVTMVPAESHTFEIGEIGIRGKLVQILLFYYTIDCSNRMGYETTRPAASRRRGEYLTHPHWAPR